MVNTKASVFLFAGDDTYLKEKAIKDLTSSILDGSSKDLDYKVFYGGEVEPTEIIDQIDTIPFLARRRLVVLRGLEKTGPDFRSRLAGHLKRPLKSTCVILESSDESVFAEFTGISGSPAVRRFGAITPREILSWIREAFAQRQKRIEEQGAILLMEMYGQNLTALDQEIGKICSYAGSRGVVRSVDVEDVAGKSLISSVFDLADAIGAGRSDTAMRICHDLVAEGKKEYEIIGLLCWHLKRLLKARSLQSRGLGDDRIASELRIAHRYRAGFFAQVSGLGMFRIRTGLKALLEADLDIKRTRFDPTLVLEFALIRICRRASS